MPTRNRAHALTLSVASMAAVLSLALATPNAGAAPTDTDPTTPTTSAQPAPETNQPAPTSADPSTGESTAPTSEAPSSTPTAPTSDPSTSAPSTSTTPSTDAPKSTTTAPKPQARAAVAAGCQTYPPTTYQVCGRIRDKYNQLNGPNGYLLFPKSNELTNPNNTGKRSEFLGGNIYWSTATDAHPVAHDFLTKWGQYGYEGGFMKYPTTDEIPLGGLDGRRQEFQGAWMYYSIPTGTHNVQGAILDKYKSMGAQASALGYPTSDEAVTPDGVGRYNTFQNGAIYWTPGTGAHFITQPMFAYYGFQNYEKGYLGYPTTDTYTNDDGVPAQGFQNSVVDLNLASTTEAGSCYSTLPTSQEMYLTDSYDYTTCIGRVSIQRPAPAPKALNWSLVLNTKMRLKGKAGPSTPMTCQSFLNKDGEVQPATVYNDLHKNIPLDYQLHSTVSNNETGPQYDLATYCVYPNNTNGTTVLKYVLGYKFK